MKNKQMMEIDPAKLYQIILRLERLTAVAGRALQTAEHLLMDSQADYGRLVAEFGPGEDVQPFELPAGDEGAALYTTILWLEQAAGAAFGAMDTTERLLMDTPADYGQLVATYG